MSARHELYVNCATCGNTFRYPASRKSARFCSRLCMQKRTWTENERKKIGEATHSRDWSSKRSAENIKTRFYRLIEITGSCWLWRGNKKDTGYGRFYFDRDNKSITSHRASWIIHNGDISNSMHVLHKCDNPSCVNPNHLFLGTHQDNMNDMDNKNRRGRLTGTTNHQSKLTDDQVREIRSVYPTLSSYKLAAKYGVSRTLINNILKRKAWDHVK